MCNNLSPVAIAMTSFLLLVCLSMVHVSMRADVIDCDLQRSGSYHLNQSVDAVYYDDEVDEEWNIELEHTADRRKVYEKQFREFPNFQDAQKYLIYECEKDCSGLADRVKGIIQVYMLSVLAQRRFAIRWADPCSLQAVWEPNLLDWSFDPASVGNLTIQHVDYMSEYQSVKFKYESEDVDPETYFTDDVIMIRSNQDWTTSFRRLSVTTERFSELYQHSNSDLIRIIFHGLFKFSKKLNESLLTFFDTQVRDKKLACFHARMGVGETEGYKISEFQPVSEFLQTLNKTGSYKILVASDSQEVKQHYRDLFHDTLVDTSGPLVHIDLSPDTPEQQCSGFFRVFLDLAILSRCDTLVLTYSGFGVMAAFLRHTSRDLYSFFNTHGVFPVSRENSKKMYQFRCFGDQPLYYDICPT